MQNASFILQHHLAGIAGHLCGCELHVTMEYKRGALSCRCHIVDMQSLIPITLLTAAASAAILNDTSLPPPGPFRSANVTLPPPDPFGANATLPPPDPFEVGLEFDVDPLESPINVTEDGLELFEGDIVLTDEQRASRKGATNLWPYGRVPYVITSSSAPDRNIIRSAINHWRYSACIYFYERPESYNSSPHLRFIRSSGCWSYVGRQNSNSGQSVSIGPGCATLGIVAHEIGHALGFWHEQSRRDRDSHISVIEANILSGREHNFQVRTDERSRGVEYDLSSLMHYGGFAFSRNGMPTIITNDVLLAGKIGQRRGLSHRDRHLANLLYQCDRYCICIPRCRNGGYVDRYCRCRCPPYTYGAQCERVIGPYYGPTCGNQRITRPGLITSINFPRLYPRNQHCIWKITAPTGRCIRIQFHTARVIRRSGTRCYWDWLALHLNTDSMPDRVSCGTELQGVTLVTSSNRLVIEMHSYRTSVPSLQTGFNATVTFF